MRDALAGGNRATTFHHHQFSLAGVVRAKRGTPGPQPQVFHPGKLGKVASVQGCLMTPVSFSSRAAAIFITAPLVAFGMTIAPLSSGLTMSPG